MKTITAHVCVSRIRYWSWFVAINFKAPGTINTWVEFILRLNLALAYFAYPPPPPWAMDWIDILCRAFQFFGFLHTRRRNPPCRWSIEDHRMYCLHSGQSANKTYSQKEKKETKRKEKKVIGLIKTLSISAGKELCKLHALRDFWLFFSFKHKRTSALQFHFNSRGSAHAQERVSKWRESWTNNHPAIC